VRRAAEIAESAKIGKTLEAVAPDEEFSGQRYAVIEPRYDARIETKVIGTTSRTLRRGRPVRTGKDCGSG
jgi:hypothetical protein